MNEELAQAADEVLTASGQTPEFKRRLLKLLDNITSANCSDGDVLQVIDLAKPSDEDYPRWK